MMHFGESRECIEVLLRIILGRNDITIISVHPQSWLENITCRSVRLDALASDSGGRIYDIEVQKRTGEASRKRARYYSSMLDAAALGKGMGFDALPDSFVIFITEGDAIGSGEAIYHVARKVEETGEAFGDGSEIIYVSSSLTKPETELGRLMEDMKCTDPEKMHYTVIKERTEFLKMEKEGIAIMSSMFDE
ncbi:MAG: PD-(D/E)XK nuclease family transposase, partial [Spirochaetes bacterium]|nr:PD-(D/E)XK nuclease family transposase [Candidatus Ornithospirochaeta stercoripullorum]